MPPEFLCARSILQRKTKINLGWDGPEEGFRWGSSLASVARLATRNSLLKPESVSVPPVYVA